MEFVEVRGELDVEDAIAQAVAELGLASAEEAEIEVVAEGRKPIIGRFGGSETLVRARPKSEQPKKKRRRRRGGKRDASDAGKQSPSGEKPSQQKGGGKQQQSGKQRSGKGRSGSNQEKKKQGQGQSQKSKNEGGSSSNGRGNSTDVAGQAERVDSFLNGLVSAFGIEGSVKVSTEKDTVLASVEGEQTETLVGQKGAVMAAVQEVTRTVVQRRFHQPARVRVDIAGYRERRRQALSIYAERLANQVLEEGGEIMLEPMNAADRKVVHDTVGEIDGVETYSEGQEPRRSVVISKVDEGDRSEEE